MNHKLRSSITITLCALLLPCLPALASEDESVEFMPAVSAYYGPEAYQVQLGMGYWNKDQSEHGQFYLSHFEANDVLIFDGQSLGEKRYSSSRLGLEATGFKKGQAFEGGAFVYRNKSQANIDRYGVGFAVSLGKMLGDRTRLLAGVELMPEYLSSDWDADALLEYSLKAGASFRLSKSIEAGISYRFGATLDSPSADHCRTFLAGFSFRL